VFFYGIVFYSIACYLLWQRRHESFARSLYFVLFSLIFIILIFIVNSYIVVVYHVESLAENKPINNSLLLAIFISGYLRNVGFIMMVSHRLYQDLRETALQDFLTKIYNRRATQQILDRQFYQFQRYHNICSIILLDIDYFKLVNDNYGHEIGDKVLQMVTFILKNNLRKTDTLGRWGGEEFLCILPNTNLEKATEVAEKLRREIAENDMENITCTISLGVKMLDYNDHTIDEAVKRADDALYNAKHKGRNCVVAFTM
jgi:diguanylate cyclase (GGDEF)-like protein